MAITKTDNTTITQKDFNNIISSFELDMTSIFKIIQENTEAIIRKAEREGWDAERLINEVSNIV